MQPRKKDFSVLDVLCARHAEADRFAAKGLAYKHDVQDMDLLQRSILDDCLLCIERAMTNRRMTLRVHVEPIPGAVIYTYAAVMNVPSISEAKYSVPFPNEHSGHVRAFPHEVEA